MSFDTALFVDIDESASQNDGAYVIAENIAQYRQDIRRHRLTYTSPFYDENGHSLGINNIVEDIGGVLVKVEFLLTATNSMNLIAAAQEVSVLCCGFV